MRELRFRVWDKDTAKYVDGVGELYADILEVGTKVFRIEQMCPGRYIIELYTGFNDMNGNEIYEGDIVRGHSPYYIENFEIAWREDRAGYFGFATDDYTCPLCNLEHVEVIGNIHENRELLEDTNVLNKEEE